MSIQKQFRILTAFLSLYRGALSTGTDKIVYQLPSLITHYLLGKNHIPKYNTKDIGYGKRIEMRSIFLRGLHF
jgi:hypothetical protein